MRSSDFLFRLIKAMSKGDRRNFKLFARLQEGDKKYVQLFDAIDRQSEYDEAELLEQFEGERFTKQFSVAKNYLYNYILKTLHVFHKDQYSELNTLMHQIQILMGKNLHEQAGKMVRKAKHLAEKQERFQEMIYLLEYERMILHRAVQNKQFEAFVKILQENEKDNLEKLANLKDYDHLYDEIYTLMKRTSAARGEKEIRDVKRILANPLLADEKNAKSVRARLKMFGILNDCYRAQRDFASCLTYTQKMIETYEANPVIRVEKNLRYIDTVSNLGVLNYMLGNSRESLSILNKLKDLETFSEYEELRIIEKYFHFKMGLCIELGDVKEGKKTLEEFKSVLSKVEGSIMKSVELSMYHAAAYFHLQAGEPSLALPWVNKILNEPKTELRTDLQCMARILNLVIHLELGNRDFVEYNIKSTTRFLANRDRLFNFEKTVIKYLRQLANLGPSDNRSDVLDSFRKDLLILLEEPAEKKATILFDALLWISASQKGVTMFEIDADQVPVHAK